MTFDESNAGITESFTGRCIDHVVRNGKVLEFVTSDGHVIKLQADVNGDIQFKGREVRIMMPRVSFSGVAGAF